MRCINPLEYLGTNKPVYAVDVILSKQEEYMKSKGVEQLEIDKAYLDYWEQIYVTTHSEAMKQRAADILKLCKEKQNDKG